jgi:hypothetical protein
MTDEPMTRARKINLAAQAYAHGHSVSVQAEAANEPIETILHWQRREPEFWQAVEYEKELIAEAMAS